jgi:hypothetical protein
MKHLFNTISFLLLSFFLSIVAIPCYSQFQNQFKIEKKDFQKLIPELSGMPVNVGDRNVEYRSEILGVGTWKGQIAGLLVNYSELELRITQTEPIIKGTWIQTIFGTVPHVPYDSGEIVGKNDSGKILLILKTSFSNSTYYLHYLSGKCLTWDLGLRHDMHKHYFFGVAESEQTIQYGYPGSYFEFRKEDWTEGKK